MDRRTKTRSSIAKVARGAVFTALGCVFLLVSYPFAALDLTMASFAALFVWIMRLEYGTGFALTVYAATATLCFIITPGNSGVICYTLIFGWFPIYKVIIEKHIRRRAFAVLLKLLAVIAAFALMLAIFFSIFIGDMSFDDFAKDLSFLFSPDSSSAGWFEEKVLWGLNRIQWLLIGAYLIFAPIITLIYDLLLSKFAVVYFYKIRPLLVKAHIFGEMTSISPKRKPRADQSAEQNKEQIKGLENQQDLNRKD